MRKRRLRNPLFILLVLVLGASSWYVFDQRRQGQALEDDMTALRRMGVPLSQDDILAKLPKEGENAAPIYQEAIELMLRRPISSQENLSLSSFLSTYEDLVRLASQKRAPAPNDKAVVRKMLSDRTEVLDLIANAVTKPRAVFREGTGQAGISSTESAQLSQISRLCDARTKMLADEGDKEGAIKWLRMTWQMSKQLAAIQIGGINQGVPYDRALYLAHKWPRDKQLLSELIETLREYKGPKSAKDQLLLEPMRSRQALLADPNRLTIAHQAAAPDSFLPSPAVGWLIHSNWVRRGAEQKVVSYWRRVFEGLPDDDPTFEKSFKHILAVKGELQADSSLSGHLAQTVIQYRQLMIDHYYWRVQLAIAEMEQLRKDPAAKFDAASFKAPEQYRFPEPEEPKN